MTARFRPVWLILDPFTGTRALLGALIDGAGRVEFVSAPQPAPSAWRPADAALAALVVEELEATQSFDDAPLGAGPQVVLGTAADVPTAVESPARWVAEQVIGRADAA